jgi:hypothetical protein
MGLGEIKAAFPKPSVTATRSIESSAAERAEESRALVPATPTVADGRDLSSNYRPAAFLAHLIAVKDQHPQTRERRRVEPHDAVVAYRATAALINQ